MKLKFFETLHSFCLKTSNIRPSLKSTVYAANYSTAWVSKFACKTKSLPPHAHINDRDNKLCNYFSKYHHNQRFDKEMLNCSCMFSVHETMSSKQIVLK